MEAAVGDERSSRCRCERQDRFRVNVARKICPRRNPSTRARRSGNSKVINAGDTSMMNGTRTMVHWNVSALLNGENLVLN